MNKGLGFLGLMAVLALGLGGCAVAKYNQLVTTQETISSSWAQVENVLQRRFDLIPSLVETVKGYAKHERELLTKVTELRSQWGAAKAPSEKIEAAGQLESALGRLMVVLERYPELKANQNFLKLQDELAGTENRIAVERMRYNEAVREYNVTLRRFPANLVAGLFGFEKSEAYFEAKEGAAEPPKVTF